MLGRVFLNRRVQSCSGCITSAGAQTHRCSPPPAAAARGYSKTQTEGGCPQRDTFLQSTEVRSPLKLLISGCFCLYASKDVKTFDSIRAEGSWRNQLIRHRQGHLEPTCNPIHACTSPHLQSADLSVGPLQTEGHELSYCVFPQTVELCLLSAELDQHQRQLFRLHTPTHTHTEERRAAQGQESTQLQIYPQRASTELTGSRGCRLMMTQSV